MLGPGFCFVYIFGNKGGKMLSHIAISLHPTISCVCVKYVCKNICILGLPGSVVVCLGKYLLVQYLRQLMYLSYRYLYLIS